MTKRAITVLSVFLLAQMPMAFAENEFAIVTGQHGYLLNDRDQVVDSVIMGAVFRVTDETGDFLVVRHLGEKLRLHKRLCLSSEDWDYVNADNAERVFASLKQLELGLREQELGNNDRAIEVLQKAASATDRKLPIHAWIGCFEAYIHFTNEDYGKANSILAECQTELRETGAEAEFFGSDLLNTQALIKSGEGELTEAVKLHEQALSASKGKRPKNHVDIAILNSNLSAAYSAAEDYSAAINSQKKALDIFKTIYPPSAKELPLATVRLANTYQDAEQFDDAAKFYESALRNLITYHPHLIYEVASARESLADTHRSLGNYDASEKACRDLIKSLRKFDFEDDIAYRKSAYQRLALSNYDQENYAAALQYCEDAIKLADQENFNLVDGFTFEFGGDAYVGLKRFTEAKLTYEKAVEIYVQVEGADSQNLVTVRASLTQIEADIAEAESVGLDSVVVVAEPRGYLLDEDDNIITLVPGLTVLKWISAEDDYHEVEFKGQVGRLSNSQLRLGRQIPGYGAVSVDSLIQVMAFAAAANNAFDAGERADCQQALAEGKLACDDQDIQGTTLDYWHRLHVLTLVGRMDGTRALFEKVKALESGVSSFDETDYPIQIDYESTAAYVLGDQGQPDGLSKQQQSLKLSEDAFGANHGVSNRARSRLAKIMVAFDDYESAIAEFGKVITTTQQIYPPKTPEFANVIVDLAVPIINSTNNEIATSILEGILKHPETLTFQSQSLAMAMLGKVYADSGNFPAARTIFTAVINAQKNNKNVPMLAITQAHLQSGRLDLREQKWNAAIAALKKSLEIYNENGAAGSFAVAEVHRLLADAYEGTGDSQSAASQLQTVLKMYRGLGGADSPRAKEIRERLQTMAAAPVREEPQPTFDIAQYFNFAPEGEKMLIAQRKCSVFADTGGPSDKTIGEIEAEAVVCSLQESNGRHRIYVQDQKKFGWVNAGDFVLQEDALIKKAFRELDKLAGTSDRQKQEVAAIRSAFDSLRQPQPATKPGDILALENAIRLLKKHKQRDSFPYIVISADLAAMYAREGKTLKAAELISDQLSALLSVVRYKHPLVAANRMKQATRAKQRGDNNKAGSETETVISICEKHFGPNDPRTQFQRMGLAGIEVRQGFFDDAREAYEIQLEVEKGNSGASLTLAAAHLGLAGLEASADNDQKAGEHAIAALEALRDMNFPIPDMTAQGLTLLARSVGRGGEFQEALGLLEQVGTLAPQAGPEAKLLTLIQQSTIAAHMNDGDASLNFAKAADVFAIENFGENHFRRHDALQAAGRAQRNTNPTQAAIAYDQARQLSLAYINDTIAYQKPSHQISFLHADELLLEEALSLSADGKSAIEQTTTWMLNFHNLLPRVLARERQARALVNDRQEYNALYLSASERTKRAELPLFSLTEAKQLQVDQVAADMAAEEQSYARNLPAKPKKVMNEPLPWITPAAIKQQLADDEVLIMIREVRPAYQLEEDPFGGVPPSKFDRRSYMAWIVSGESADRIAVVKLPNDVESVRNQIDAVTRFVSEINDAAKLGVSPSAKLSSNFQNDLGRLSDSVWKPIVQRLKPTVRKLTLCLDGSLHRIPWEALPTRTGRIVLDDFTLRYITSPRDLLPRQTTSEAGAAIVMVKSAPSGQEDLNTYAPSTIDHINRITGGSGHPFSAEIRNDLLNMAVLSRAGEDDIVELARPFIESFGEESSVYKENEASEIRYYLLDNPQAIHIGAYSMVTPAATVRDISFSLSQSRTQIESPSEHKANPLLRCCLTLAGFDIKDTPQHLLDGILTGEEIVTNNLSATELVTLSYAARATSNNVIDDSSLLIPQAFLLAGAHSVVAPQWQADEAASLAILKSFYEELAAGKSNAESLRTAQLKFREASKRRGNDHPMYWAAFRLTGQR
ncbi:MAG: CHAT domain-containing tetratricopeptide repeat protein [Fuerstiella sp.]